MERNVSYGEIIELECLFDKQCEEHRIVWDDDEVRLECMNDLIIQYQNGDDSPHILLCGYGYHIS